jgi:pyrroline-5-carboxylate reductase
MDLALIGTGIMGQALVKSFWQKKMLPGHSIRLYDTDIAKAEKFARVIRGKCCPTAAEAAFNADIVLLAVKPSVIQAAIASVAEHLTRQTILISIAAGTTLGDLRRWAGPAPAIARAMPNMPAQVSLGVTAVCFDQAESDQCQTVLDLLQSCGLVFEIREDLMDVVTGLSGSGPAYVMMIIEALADGGVLLGLPRDIATRMAAMTLMGSAKVVLETGQHPAQLRDQVCTPGGTTVEGLLTLEEEGLRSALIHAVCSAADKSRMLREQTGEHG